MSEKKEKPTITPRPDGPYLVTGLDRLASRKGPIACREKVALCRCGGSSTKPFCDGTHKSNGFSSAKLDGRIPDAQDDYASKAITVHDNRGICAHAGKCTDGLPSVFRLKQEPWIDPDGATAAKIVETIETCPSGALRYTLGGATPPEADREPSIFVAPNGPYVVSGAPDLLGTDRGVGASHEHFTLCRCGGSKNKPFCDGSHWHNGFTDDDN